MITGKHYLKVDTSCSVAMETEATGKMEKTRLKTGIFLILTQKDKEQSFNHNTVGEKKEEKQKKQSTNAIEDCNHVYKY